MIDWYGEIARRWKSYSVLTSAEKKIYFSALTVLMTISLSLKISGYHKTRQRLDKRIQHRWESRKGTHQDEESYQSEAIEIADIVGKAAWRSWLPVTCLPRSMALWYMLQQRNIDSDLRIGVNKFEGQMQAHAWVEVNGFPLLENPEVREIFAAFTWN